MKERIKYLRQMIKNNNIEGNTDEHYLWSLCCVDYFYYEGNIDPRSIRTNWTDGQHDGGIDYVYSTNDKLYLIQGKSSPGKIKLNDIKNYIRFMADTVEIFELGQEIKKELNKTLRKAYKIGINNKTKNDIILVLFTNSHITEKLKEEIEDWTKNYFNDFKVEVYGIEEIEEQEVKVINGEKTINSGYLECADENFLEYSTEKGSGIILSVKAKSLQDLYQKEKDGGLFGYNLREKINDNKLHVDYEIDQTIKKEKENFWFYNNGITIGCEDYKIKDNKLKLKKFSIINGAQTTNIIGTSKDIDNQNNFSIVCKVIKSPESLDNEFIKKISLTSNSQKEIDMRDTFSNSEEQIILQYRFIKNKYPLAVTIKRGVKPRNYNNVKPWQKIENSKLGQIILSAFLQKPGTARNQPNSIFTDLGTYNSIFNKKIVLNYNYNALYDIVRLHKYYENYRIRIIKSKELKKSKETKSIETIRKLQDEIGVLKNSGYTVVSVITYLIKRKYFGLSKIKGDTDEAWKKFVSKKITTDLSLNYNNKKNTYEKHLKVLFENILLVLFDLYNHEVTNPKSTVTSVSNYFKRDDIYRNNIIPAFDNIIDNDPNNIIFKELKVFDDSNNK